MKSMLTIAVVSLLAALSAAVASTPQAGQAQTTEPGASISGRLTYPDGRPAWRKPVDFVNARDLTYRDVVRTDPDGRYTITGLANGVYFIGEFDAARLPADKNPRIEDLPDPSAHQKEFGIPKGQRVVIANGQSVEGVDFVITDIGDPVAVIDVGPAGATVPALADERRAGGYLLVGAMAVLCGLAILGATFLGIRARAH